MRRRLFVMLAAVAMLLAMAAPSSAVMFGEKDSANEWDGVGLVVFDVDGEPSHRCTGSLIADDVLLTAGHCTFGTSGARVFFDVDVTSGHYPGPGPDAIEGTPVTHPDYDDFATFPDTSDVGVVLLDAPAALDTYPLAGDATLDSLGGPKGLMRMDIVGYGLQSVKPALMAERSRYVAEVKLNNLVSANTDGFNVQLSSNPGKAHRGGLCFGDSGGAVFLDGEIVAVNSFVLNLQCMGNGFSYRVDRQPILDWLAGF